MPALTSPAEEAISQTRDDLLQLLQEKRLREAVSLVRRVSRAELATCRRFVSELSSGQWTWSQLATHHPSLVAALAGDPDPVLLRRLEQRRGEVIRCLLRGRRLEALRLVQAAAQASAVTAKLFLEALVSRGLAWDEVLARYDGSCPDFWRVTPRGPGLPERPPAEALWTPPDTFRPADFEALVRSGQFGRAVSLVRRFARQPLATAQAFVEACETQTWAEVAQAFPSVVATLAGDPDPELLERLEPVRQEYLEALHGERKLAALRLAQEVGGASLARATALFRALQACRWPWDEVLASYREGRFTWPPQAEPAPPPPVPQRKARPKPPRQLQVAPPPAPPDPAPETPPPPPIDPREFALRALAHSHPELARLLPEGQLPEDLAGLGTLLEEVARLSAQGDPQALVAASQALLVLEGRGLTRDQLVRRHPELEWVLPPGRLSSHASKLAALLPLLQAGQVVEAAAETLPDEVEPLLAELEGALKAREPERLQASLKPLLGKLPREELERRFPDLSHGLEVLSRESQVGSGKGTEDLGGLLSTAGRSQLEKRFPKLAARLNEQKLTQLRRLQPEVLKLLKRGRIQKALTLVQEQLGLGLADTKALLEILGL